MSAPSKTKTTETAAKKPAQSAELSSELSTAASTTATQTQSQTKPLIAPADAIGIFGALHVNAKSEQGFWRCGIQFHRLEHKLLLVVDDVIAAAKAETKALLTDIEDDYHFITRADAKRIHDEPNLIVEPVDIDGQIAADGTPDGAADNDDTTV